MARVWIGTSGWQYADWEGRFYPEKLPKSGWLAHYATVFDTLEVNGTFYSLPKPATVRSWCEAVGEDFVFAYKASRYLSHMKRLKDAAQPLAKLAPITDAFGEKAGPMLVQLPPHWTVNVERFRAFLDELPAKQLVAHEFRDESWFTEEIYDLLRLRGDALVITDISGRPSPAVITGQFTYIRLHGPDEAYRGSYSDADLDGWAEKIGRWLGDGIEVYCYFDNDRKAAAPEDARRLLGRLCA